MTNKFENIDYWKAIVLYGLNNATYKIALGKTILELAEKDKTSIDWDVLSKSYFDNYLNRLKVQAKPQQSNPTRRTVMERIVNSYESGKLTYDQAVDKVGLDAFHDVIPRFQSIGTDKNLVGERFYHYDHGNKLFIHDSLFLINESHQNELLLELDARWSLLEGAFSMSHENWDLANDIRDIYLKNGYDRTNITSNIPFLQGYQGNVCFYCGEEMKMDDIHVDHVLPRQVIQHDEIWNLVLSHGLCNMHKNDALVGTHYLDKLQARNENIMGSNHPWKKKIAESLGNTALRRSKMTLYHYENIKIALNYNYWEHSPNYNRETDPFYKKLITKLNNK